MTPKNPTNKDILDAIENLSSKVTQNSTDLASLSGVVSQIAVDVTKLKSDVSTLKSDVSMLKSDVSTLKADVAILKADMIEVQDEQERQSKKLDQIAGTKSFNPFKSGAFVA